MKRACIISIGAELIAGQTVDTNAAWLAAQLATAGVRCTRHITVGDNLVDIVTALHSAASQADLVLATGGLGPTADDLTRQALAEASGYELTLDAPSAEQIRAFFARRGRRMPEQNLVQANKPAGAVMIENPSGTAPGIHLTIDNTPCFALPGVPHEMRAMFQQYVLPIVQAAAVGRIIRIRRLHCAGMGESDLGERIADLMQPGRNPEIGTAADLGSVTIRLTATADDTITADALLDDAELEIRRRLGPVVFGRDDQTLAAVVGKLLQARGLTLATAESCTGGLIGKLLTDTPGSSAYYVGGVIAYANEVKRDLLGVSERTLAESGAVSGPVAAAMAEGARKRLGASKAVSTTGIAGPGGGTSDKPVGLVWIGVATDEGVLVRRHLFGQDASREVVRILAAQTALNRVRLVLLTETGASRPKGRSVIAPEPEPDSAAPRPCR